MTVEEHLEYIKNRLNEYEETLNLPKNKSPLSTEEVEKYLNMTKDEVETSDCKIINLRLTQYSLYLHRCINREKSIVVWANDCLVKTISSEFMNYANVYGSFELKTHMICKENEVARKYQQIAKDYEERVSRLEDLYKTVKGLAYAFYLLERKGNYIKAED